MLDIISWGIFKKTSRRAASCLQIYSSRGAQDKWEQLLSKPGIFILNVTTLIYHPL